MQHIIRNYQWGGMMCTSITFYRLNENASQADIRIASEISTEVVQKFLSDKTYHILVEGDKVTIGERSYQNIQWMTVTLQSIDKVRRQVVLTLVGANESDDFQIKTLFCFVCSRKQLEFIANYQKNR